MTHQEPLQMCHAECVFRDFGGKQGWQVRVLREIGVEFSKQLMCLSSGCMSKVNANVYATRADQSIIQSVNVAVQMGSAFCFCLCPEQLTL